MPYESIPVFFIQPTNRYRREFRRYASPPYEPGPRTAICPNGPYKSYHDASVFIEIVTTDDQPTSGRNRDIEHDIRWPTKCDHCDYAFKEEDNWQDNHTNIYVAADGREMTLRDNVPGACWDATWYYKDENGNVEPGAHTGPDGRYLIANCPNGHQWMMDWYATNCTMPDDKEHRCWVRHGRPEDGTLHVDKNGHTCAAGAGSIVAGDYHGFLHNGHFTAG